MRSLRVKAIAGLAGVIAIAIASLAVAADEASKPPKQILADAGKAIGQVKSFHLEGRGVDGDGRTTMSGDLSNSAFALSITLGKQKLAIRKVNSVAYTSANAAFWRSSGLSRAQSKLLANRWVKVPAASATEFDFFTPKTFSRCITRHTGTLSKKVQTVNGRRTIVLIDAGDKPGTAPGRLYLSASGPPLAVRMVQTGPQRRGGPKDAACAEDGKGDDTKSFDASFSAFNKPVKITAPKNALDLSKATAAAAR